MSSTLFYVHDPMCSWCWGFKSELAKLESTLPADVSVRRIVGGLAADSDEPMPAAMQSVLQSTWENIATTIPGTQFNFDFWTNNQPRRSTYPSCRAVLAARRQNQDFELPMITAIQEAYYLHARNPSDIEVLISIAGEIGCDPVKFEQDLLSDDLQTEFHNELRFCQQLGVQGFPSLVLHAANDQWHRIAVDYHSAPSMLDRITQLNLG